MNTLEAKLKVLKAEESQLIMLISEDENPDEVRQQASLRLNARITERREVEKDLAKEQGDESSAA